ncbi:hypothetical protein QBC41DRAFT_305579 [Cercophora samala]|uniref:Uncharacterized protein n=1 Tax=Cercophora samala TaxID=330535 RepID=A0AA40D7R0_9PEZI|nr:hypothetical protein QBC41DRAFT_305579 [Cercophora samala]
MFSLKNIVTLLALAVFSASAAPAADVSVAEAASEQPAIVARQAWASVYACQHVWWGLPCQGFSPYAGQCIGVPAGYNDRISSIRNNNKNNFHCVWYEHGGCTGRSYANQEDANLADGDGFFNDRISSMRCNYIGARVASNTTVESNNTTVPEASDLAAPSPKE